MRVKLSGPGVKNAFDADRSEILTTIPWRPTLCCPFADPHIIAIAAVLNSSTNRAVRDRRFAARDAPIDRPATEPRILECCCRIRIPAHRDQSRGALSYSSRNKPAPDLAAQDSVE
jgi:hypothetical protein